MIGSLRQQWHWSTLQELRAPCGELLGEAMAEAYKQGLEKVVRDWRNVPPEYNLVFSVHDNYYSHAWAHSPITLLMDWLHGNQRSHE